MNRFWLKGSRGMIQTVFRKAGIAAALVFIFGVSSAPNLFAQSSVTSSATIKIGVTTGLSLYVDRNLNFGTVVTGTGIDSIGLASSMTGHVTLSGSNKTVYVTLTPPASLSNGANTISYTPRAAYNATADDPSTATIMSASGTTSFKPGDNHLHGNTYYAYIYLYGSINVGSVPAGSYSGTYTVAVTY